MSIWAIADLHLSFGVPNKLMDIFGPQWVNHAARVEKAWKENVSPDDLVLIPGDISWAMQFDEVRPDLEWIHKLPGTKVCIKGNHDYWWSSISKIRPILPPSCHLIQNDSFTWKDVSIGGSRMWDTSEYNFDALFEDEEPVAQKTLTESDVSEDKDKIFRRELGRLENSLKTMDQKAKLRIAMTHYPAIGLDLKDSSISRLLEKYNVNICVFGHIHNVQSGLPLFGIHNGVEYHLVACDYLNCTPLKITSQP
ncbi:MAG: metallophosphoesterase [Parachlamydiaceae bacterium]|nr:metallophosphoesterase [Parachlamydiaceae bacterium]